MSTSGKRRAGRERARGRTISSSAFFDVAFGPQCIHENDNRSVVRVCVCVCLGFFFCSGAETFWDRSTMARVHTSHIPPGRPPPRGEMLGRMRSQLRVRPSGFRRPPTRSFGHRGLTDRAMPSLYRHYRADIYEVLATVLHTETNEHMVLYEAHQVDDKARERNPRAARVRPPARSVQRNRRPRRRVCGAVSTPVAGLRHL